MSTTATKALRRDPAEVEPWAETCGQIRPLIEEQDEVAAEVHHVEIQDAKLHYHASSTVSGRDRDTNRFIVFAYDEFARRRAKTR